MFLFSIPFLLYLHIHLEKIEFVKTYLSKLWIEAAVNDGIVSRVTHRQPVAEEEDVVDFIPTPNVRVLIAYDLDGMKWMSQLNLNFKNHSSDFSSFWFIPGWGWKEANRKQKKRRRQSSFWSSVNIIIKRTKFQLLQIHVCSLPRNNQSSVFSSKGSKSYKTINCLDHNDYFRNQQ